MYITVCNKQFPVEDIQSIKITDSKVFIETTDDFFDMRYTSEEQLQEARGWLKAKSITLPELREAVTLIITVCTVFLNTKEQCFQCPLKKKNGCVFSTIPINWRI